MTDAIHFEFGDDQFAVVVSVSETFDEKPKFNQIEISISGDGWKLHSPETETLSVVSERLGEFVGDATTRHWGAFAGISNYEAALERVEKFAFGEAELGEIEATALCGKFGARTYPAR